MKTKMNLFAYGTLMWPKVMTALIGRCPEGVPAVLSGYVRLRVKDANYPAIKESAGHSVEGILYRGLTDREMQVLDHFEGEEYDRKKVRIGAEHAAAYVLSPEYDHVVETATWHPEQFRPEHFKSVGLDPESAEQ